MDVLIRFIGVSMKSFLNPYKNKINRNTPKGVERQVDSNQASEKASKK